MKLLKYFLWISVFICIIARIPPARAESEEFQSFLKNCGWGTALGATLGLLSVAVSDRPNDSMGNIARGASLGLYGGIIYGLAIPNNLDLYKQEVLNKSLDKKWNFHFVPLMDVMNRGFSAQAYFSF